MSTYYKIGELASLYGISTDVLRYYEELNILVPQRGANGYRLYRTEDLWCLNIIRDLRDLGFSMEQIRIYIEHRSIKSSLELLNTELNAINNHISHLMSLKNNILTRREIITMAQSLQTGEILVKYMVQRSCHRIVQSYRTDEEMDILIKQLVSFGQDKHSIIGNNQMGSFLDIKEAQKGNCRNYNAVFILDSSGEHFIEEGQYLSICYHGCCDQNFTYVPLLFQYANENHMEICGPLLELLWIDIHTSKHLNEHITELQLKIK